MKKSKNILIVLISIALLTLLSALGIFRKFESRFFDLLLSAKKSPQESPQILLVEADNLALENIGAWPWKRSVYANMLLRMKELGAKTAVFDIEFLSPSDFEDSDEEFARSVQFFGNTFLTINTADLDINYTEAELNYARNRFLVNVDGDINSIITGNRKSIYETQKDSLFGFNKVDWNNQKTKNDFSIGFSPAMHKFISHANGAGFTNTIIDTDGTRRRVELLKYQEECQKSVCQLVFSPLLKELAPEKIIRKKNSIVLKNCTQGSKTQDIKIPLDEYGRMIINWTHKKYQDSFRHESILFMDTLDKTEQNIVLVLEAILENLDTILKSDIAHKKNLAAVISPQAASLLLQQYGDITDYKNYLLQICDGYDKDGNAVNSGIPEELYAEYFSLRNVFFTNARNYAAGNTHDLIQECLLENRDFFGEQKYAEYASVIGELFEILLHDTNLYCDLFNEKSAVYKNSFCIIGNTASSTTDLGTTPFERAYPNIGTHANVCNTIINSDFIAPVNFLFGIFFTALLVILQIILTEKKKSIIQNSTGIFVIIAIGIIPFLLIKCLGIYVPSFTPVLIAFTSYLEITILRFAASEKDKKFLQTTFGAYVAPAVVEQIVKHPKLASLGGKSENLTALFSDVKTFSGFTEVINSQYGEEKGAERLVEILNEYLGDLSDAIMQNGGTIDKYVGDEIVSFFGAPVPCKNNAFDACTAAIRMLQAEKLFNERNKDLLPVNPHTNEPFYLHSRIGLNTGMMVVGNMGTEKKLNYTIMGNNVNLASRLEGTNKVYGSWIIASESTWQKADSGENKGKLVARKLDFVRVVNVKKPVGIYNILGLKEELSEQQIKAAEIFNTGIELYLKGSDTPEVKKDIAELKEALSYFEKASSIYPADESSKVFIDRCNDFIKNGVPKIWDGVYTMQSK